MSSVLFGAEADKIQAALFRAARQRQVVGGSRLLVEFSEVAKAIAERKYRGDVRVAAGGNFRILFPNETDAKDFGRELANAYAFLLDASITIAEPAPITNGFASANDQVSKSILRRKRAQRGETDSAHTPTTAFCQSSGVGLAAAYTYDYRAPREPVPGDEKYLSGFAQRMARVGREKETRDTFLGKISKCLPPTHQQWEFADDVEDIQSLDGARRNVAYLIADGNGMGELFGACDADQIRNLSLELDQAMRSAVAFPLPILAKRLQVHDVLPALPLILAGDDAFVLLPAQYSLDFAQQFCLAFEDALNKTEVIKELRAQARQVGKYIPPPTISAAVVICKGHYPYHLAHQRGEELLKRVKRLIKTIGQVNEDQSWRSALGFDFIIGSELVTGNQPHHGREYRPSFGAYWATQSLGTTDEHILVDEAKRAAIPLAQLLEQRIHLKNLPTKRLEETRELFAPDALPDSAEQLRKQWNPRLQKLLDRIAATQPVRTGKQDDGDGNESRAALTQALRELGDSVDNPDNPGHWRQIIRPGEPIHRAHGLPDLIEIWDYAQSLAHTLDDYTEEGK